MATTTKKTTSAKVTNSKYTAADLAKEVGLKNASLARRYLRAAQIPKPKDGWVWADKAAAKTALDAVSRAVRGAKK